MHLRKHGYPYIVCYVNEAEAPSWEEILVLVKVMVRLVKVMVSLR